MAAASLVTGLAIPCLFCLDYYLDRDYYTYHRIKGLDVLRHWCAKRKYSAPCLTLLATLLCCVRL